MDAISSSVCTVNDSILSRRSYRKQHQIILSSRWYNETDLHEHNGNSNGPKRGMWNEYHYFRDKILVSESIYHVLFCLAILF